MFGPLGLPYRIHLLRDLRRIELTLIVDELTSWSRLRHRARTQYFVDTLQEHAGDANRQSLLTQLRVHIRAMERGFRCVRPRWSIDDLRRKEKSGKWTISEKVVFVLEPLASLQGIVDVAIHGAPDWLKQCLEMRIRGEGGELKTLEWPAKVVKRKQKGSRKKVELEVSMRKGWQPVLDWRQFAVRNGIALPADIDAFFPVEQTEEMNVSTADREVTVAD
jgi:hypothetical protein